MNTLLLDNTNWDLISDAAGNIAAAAEPYAVAQDVASALKLFAGELWYNVREGVPYFDEILGETPPITYFQELMVRAAMTVPTVVAAECFIEAFQDRQVTGTVTFRTATGETSTVTI